MQLLIELVFGIIRIIFEFCVVCVHMYTNVRFLNKYCLRRRQQKVRITNPSSLEIIHRNQMCILLLVLLKTQHSIWLY